MEAICKAINQNSITSERKYNVAFIAVGDNVNLTLATDDFGVVMEYPGEFFEWDLQDTKNTQVRMERYRRPLRNRAYLIDLKKSGAPLKFEFFYGHHPVPNRITSSCFSQWFTQPFEVSGKIYSCMEQYMMEQKALVFGDCKVAEEIMNYSEPRDMKKAGRRVSNFNEEEWNSVKYGIIVKGNFHKFTQNEKLLEYLDKTGDTYLVEASPSDKIWGIGMDRNHPLRNNVECWVGENLLGFALTEVRDLIRNGRFQK